MKREETLIFAYGSNMCLERLLARITNVSPYGRGFLPGWKLAFNKRGLDGSAKANVRSTGNVRDRTWGVVYQVTQSQKQVLDRYESLGIGYDRTRVDIHLESGTCQSWVYVARPQAIHEQLAPFSWYVDFLRIGARQHELPDHYQRFLERVNTIQDPDRERHQRNQALLPDR